MVLLLKLKTNLLTVLTILTLFHHNVIFTYEKENYRF